MTGTDPGSTLSLAGGYLREISGRVAASGAWLRRDPRGWSLSQRFPIGLFVHRGQLCSVACTAESAPTEATWWPISQ